MNGKSKRFLLAALLLAAVILCTACGGGSGSQSGAPTANEVPVVLSQIEYTLYQNIFMNGTGSQYEGREFTKEGVFGKIYDAFSDCTRYYVWGYLDNTRCCDWQWEIKIDDPKNVPASGSLVTVKGTFTASRDALDGYWLTNPEITAHSQYTGGSTELEMCTLSDTLERVQIYNIIRRPETFEGKTFSAYGRIYSTSVLQDPYYDGSWQIPFVTKETVPAIGTTVRLTGTVVSGTLSSSTLKALD